MSSARVFNPAAGGDIAELAQVMERGVPRTTCSKCEAAGNDWGRTGFALLFGRENRGAGYWGTARMIFQTAPCPSVVTPRGFDEDLQSRAIRDR